MGTPRKCGAVVVGDNYPAVDATCARVMGIDPTQVEYLRLAGGWLGPIAGGIKLVGESTQAVRTDFALVDEIPAHQGLRLAK